MNTNINTNTNKNTNQKPVSSLNYISTNNPFFFYPMIFIIIVFIITLILVFYNIQLGIIENKADKEIIQIVLIIVTICLVILSICISLLPSFKEIKKLFQQIYSVCYVVLYTIFLVLLLSLLPDKILDNYAYIIISITMLLSVYMFYKALQNNYMSSFNANYERIRTVILMFCLLTICIVYYNINPGGLIQKYFGYSLLLSIIIFTFMFLYLIIVMTLPNYSSTNKYPRNLFSMFSNFSVYGSILFILFIILVTVMISKYPHGFADKKYKFNTAIIIILVLLICIFWGSLLASNLLPELTEYSTVKNFDFFKRSLLLLFGLVISALTIFWIVYNIQNLSGNFGITSFILNILIVIIMLGLIYKTIYVQFPVQNAKKNAFFDIIINSIFYIPCIFTNGFDFIMSIFISSYDKNTYSYLYLSLLAIILLVIYFAEPYFYNKVNLQGGKLLANQPIYINKLNNYGSYETLNDSTEYDYHYAISFWFYLDAFPPNTNPKYKKYTSLLNYANKPNVLYNPSTNTLIITMKQKDLQANNKDDSIKFFNENGEIDNQIIYTNENVLLQKWNNIIINYNGGVLDIFLNGGLVKSNNGIVPYYTLDALTVGEDNGIDGKLCNLVYFNKSLSSNNIYYLYNMVKNNNPPTTKDSNVYIIK